MLTTRIGLLCGTLGLVLCAIGVVLEPRQAFTSYLFAYGAILALVLGALAQVMISHMTSAHWFTVLRRLPLAMTASLPVLALLAFPLFVGVHDIYVWTSLATLPAAIREVVARKTAWLNVPFFISRGVFYLAVWVVLGERLRRWSIALDHAIGAAAVAIVKRQRRISAIGLILLGLTLTFAAFDWLMSLEPAWYSTIYGIYVFAGGLLGALSLIAVVAYTTQRWNERLREMITPEHFGALGKLMLTFVIFWGYIAFSQYLIIWIGDVPADVSWYVSRSHGSWGTLAIVVAIGQFAIPFVLLLSRQRKRRPGALAAIGLWILVMHVLDVYWLVLPALHPSAIHVSWLDIAALLMVGGFATATATWRASRWAAVPIGDPYLPESVGYIEP